MRVSFSEPIFVQYPRDVRGIVYLPRASQATIRIQDMSLALLETLYGLAMAIAGALLVGLFWARTARKTAAAHGSCFNQAQTIIAHLHQLALRVTVDVNEHSDRMGQINDELQSEEEIAAEAVLRRIEDIIQANQRMKDSLAETESRLQNKPRSLRPRPPKFARIP